MRHLVYLKRNAQATPDALSRLVSRADTDRVLKSKVPQALRVTDSADEANDAVNTLRGAGLDGFVVTHDELREFAPLPVRRATPLPSGLTLYDADGFGIDVEDVRIIVVGKFLMEKRRTTRTELGAGGGLAAGYPIMARGSVFESGTAERDEESFVCFIRERHEAYIAREATFDYRATLPRLQPMRELNFRALVDMARAAWPGAPCDDRLYRWPAAVRTTGETTVSAGLLVDTTQKIEFGTNEQRVLGLVYLMYLGAP